MLLHYEFKPEGDQPSTPVYDYTDREQTFFKKDGSKKPKGLFLFQILTIIIFVFLSVLIYGTFNIESAP